MQTARVALHRKASQALESIIRARGTVRIQLPLFGLEQTGALISAAFGWADVAPELTQEIYVKTGGLPLYIEQVSSFAACP